MKKTTILFFLVSLTILQFSCDSDSIDLDPQGAISSDVVFTDPAFAETYLNAVYNGVPHGFSAPDGWYMLTSATDDAENSYPWPSSNTKFNTANITSENSPFNGLWNNAYFQIRRLNNFIQNYDQLEGADAVNNRLKGEAHFLRGYFYSLLLKTFSGVPIITVPQELADDLLVSRNTKEETLNFIVSEFDTAAGFFENAETKSSTRGSWDAAIAIKARVLLYEGKYAESAVASKLVLDNTSRSLDSDYQSVFVNNDATEVIFDTQFSDPDKGHWGNLFNTPKSSGAVSGWGGTGPTQNLVDQYEMQATGLLPSEAGSGYDINNPYDGRDPRFEASIIHDGTEWKGDVFFHRPGGNAGIATSGDFTRTGYSMKKMIQEDTNHNDRSTQHWIHIRLAEVYLNYAEALIESGASLGLAVDAINAVRTRSSMPDIGLGSQSELRIRVRRERRVELAFEEHRFWDIRRWGIAGTPEVLTIYRVDMDTDGNLIDDGKEIWETRDWNVEAGGLFPIPQSERDKNTNLTQNDGY
ncbi:RagB/SusD family nutrient uptake outer membrane protein [Flavivirga spongiicola]|uniref:RagB/SusD family nutrient uptake outer membrane protein n=1 Tax=Flavivirga spongiicola TaxID=421621 RepID=A0ABU7XLL0_9FLAO|nr:RagB/SusD family nutrient uptake outer membrane protein [Flavivirga sp. MEBiC05379]MDO5981298.1 RagB/SusD family nutrient uptake outer membrane protein [Flavivirga sp. MEBiC05379]